MTKTNPLRLCLIGSESGEIVDLLLEKFIAEHCMGKNDMAVTQGLLATAALLLSAHCKRTGQEFEPLLAQLRDNFELGAKIAWDKWQ